MVEVAKNTSRSWWVNDLAVWADDQLWLSAVRRRGENEIHRVVGGVTSSVVLDGPTQADEHNAGALAVGPTTMLVVYSRHNADPHFRVQHVDRTTLALGPQQILPMGGPVTYAQLLYTPGSSTVYALCRVAEDRWLYRISLDFGGTWGPPKVLFDGTGDGKLYVATRRDTDNPHIYHMVMAGHPLHSLVRKVRHAWINLATGEISKMSGATLGNLGDVGGPAITETAMDLVVAPSSAYRVRALDVARVSSQPAVAYVIWQPDDPNWAPLYKVKRWDGSSWGVLDWVLPAGPVFGHTSGAHYHGGVGLGENGTTMWTSRKDGVWWVAEKWARSGAGYVLAAELARSRDPLIRPYPVRGGDDEVLYQDGFYGSITRGYLDSVLYS
jgi:hypothetical protein